jgi:hypothetical protein
MTDTAESVTPRNKKVEIFNFVESEKLRVEAYTARLDEGIPALVHLIQEGGSMRFQFSMTTTQARELAASLVVAADELEPVTA